MSRPKSPFRGRNGKGPAKPRKRATKRTVAVSTLPVGQKSYRVLMAEAKAEYQALLKREEQARKGGRPKNGGGGKNLTVVNGPRVFAYRCEPGDELIVALGHFGGGA